jgi:hypothetical protein
MFKSKCQEMMDNQQTVSSETNLNLSDESGVPTTTPLSSTLTLFWRVFIPVFGTVFLMGFSLGIWLTEKEELTVPFIPVDWLRYILLALLAAWLWFVWRTLWRLKRVDGNDTYAFVTNYWITVRYPWTDVEQITATRRFGRRIAHLRLKAPGRFGPTISFLPGRHFDGWMKERNLEF